MVMAKRVITLGKKACIVCQKEFQPGSGAQMTCSPECKAEAKAKGLTKRGPRNRGGVDPTLEEDDDTNEVSQPPSEASSRKGTAEVRRFSEIDPGISAVTRPGGASEVKVKEIPLGIPELELDLTPIELYIKAVVKREVLSAQKHSGNERRAGEGEGAESLREEIREIVKEEIAERLKGLLSS